VSAVDIFRMLSLAAIWGASFLFMRIIAPVIGTIPTAFFRVSIAAVGLLVILGLMRISWDFKGKLKTVMLLGVINSGIPATLYSVAAQVLPAGYSAIFNATTPLMGVLIGGLFFSEKLTAAKLTGVFLGLFGVGVLTRRAGGFRSAIADGRPRLPACHHLLRLRRISRDAGWITAAGSTVVSRPWAACSALRCFCCRCSATA
jgi:drug/metabolite transporter (DMT)-like permease